MATIMQGTPKPLRDGYDITKESKQEMNNNQSKQLFDNSVKGRDSFVTGLSRINWTGLPTKDVLMLILSVLSYGLKTNKNLFEKYIREDRRKSNNTSLFKLILEYDGMKLKSVLESNGFLNIFSSLFSGSDWEDILKKIKTRVLLINKRQANPKDIADLQAVINTLNSGQNIEPELINENQNLK